MTNRERLDVADYIVPLYMNGLYGRMLHLPAPANKKREMLLVYGHHASIERMFGLAEDLNQYGAVTLPDLPGFGGMQSFYQIGEQPTLDNLADYLAAFVKLRYKRKRVTLIGMSFGFLVITRMLQKYPELARKVDLVISIVGFVHYEDFKFKNRTFATFKFAAKLFSLPAPAWLVRHVLLRKSLIRLTYYLIADRHVKMKDADKEERKRRIDFEIGLWHCNDVRTYMRTSHCMLTVDLCKDRIDLPVYHIAVDDDRYFDNAHVEQHMKVIYKDVKLMPTPMLGHAPTVIADAKSAAPFVPAKIRRLLRAAS
jgi:pimeloyl-ACP methyl ester carboxylesterase